LLPLNFCLQKCEQEGGSRSRGSHCCSGALSVLIDLLELMD
jgi:hypothetical protein